MRTGQTNAGWRRPERESGFWQEMCDRGEEEMAEFLERVQQNAAGLEEIREAVRSLDELEDENERLCGELKEAQGREKALKEMISSHFSK